MHHSNKHQSCPCGDDIEEQTIVSCSNCKQIWHNECCNLAGLDSTTIKRLEQWKCPFCYICQYVRCDTSTTATDQNNNEINRKRFSDNCASENKFCYLTEKVSDEEPADRSLSSRADHAGSYEISCIYNVDLPKSKEHVRSSILHESFPAAFSVASTCPSKSAVLDDSHYVGPRKTCGPYVMYEPDLVNRELIKELEEFVKQEETNFKTVGEESREVLYFGIHSYRKSGHVFEPKEMPVVVTKLLDAIGPNCPPDHHAHVNSCLITRYHSTTKVDLHRDDEPVIDLASLILVVSLGAKRTMTFISNDRSSRKDILLTEGSLLITSRYSQDFWKHGCFFEESADKENIGYSFKFRNIAPYFMLSY